MFKIKKAAILGVALMSCMSAGFMPAKPSHAAELVCSVPKQVGKVVTVSSVAALKAAVAKTSGGVTIQLTPGNYGDLSFLSGKNFSSMVIITSASKSNMAIIKATRIKNSSNITLSNLKFYADGTPNVPTWGTKKPSISSDGTPQPPGGTTLVLDSSRNVTLADSLFSGHKRAIMFMNSTNVKVIGNTFLNTTMDHMSFTGMNNLLIEGNYTGAFKTYMPGHNDSIQFWNTGKGVSGNISTNVIVRNNVITSSELEGSKGGVQGVFIFSEKVAREGGGLKDFYKNIVVENNKIITRHPNAITLSATTGLRIRNNVAIADCVGRKAGWDPRLTVYKGSTNVMLAGNTANILHASEFNPTTRASMPSNWTVSGNKVTSACVQTPAPKAPGCSK